MTLPAIERARRFSEDKLRRIGDSISALVPADAVVVACGSFARREASQASDFDYFTIVSSSGGGTASWQQDLRAEISGIVRIEPAPDGAFGKVETRDAMVRNIGGQEDGNAKLTRRMLFLLEGEPLTHRPCFEDIRRAVLQRYIDGPSNGHALPLFLLDDIIRYYRTMAVDYEFKTTEGDRPKAWGLRYIKLLFSRRLLYAGGLFGVAATAGLAPAAMIERLEFLFDLPPIDRMRHICGDRALEIALTGYDRFLARLESAKARWRLETLSRAERDDPLFHELETEGRHFARELLELFERTFEPTHPIHRAIVF